jgi:hypothetical protein
MGTIVPYLGTNATPSLYEFPIMGTITPTPGMMRPQCRSSGKRIHMPDVVPLVELKKR